MAGAKKKGPMRAMRGGGMAKKAGMKKGGGVKKMRGGGPTGMRKKKKTSRR